MRLVKISRKIEKTLALLWNLFEVKITYFFCKLFETLYIQLGNVSTFITIFRNINVIINH